MITDDLRIRLPVETLTWLLDQGAEKLTVCSHLGRPKGKPDPKYAIAPVRRRLYELLEDQGRQYTSGSSCSRTCATTRAKRPTTPPSSRHW